MIVMFLSIKKQTELKEEMLKCRLKRMTYLSVAI